MSPPAVLPNQDYTVGWICALPAELAAASAMLDETHGKPREQHPSDQNSYCLGRIAEHNIVIACLPAGGYGTTSAAVVAGQMLSSFPSIRFGLLVGIGGGVPSEETDIRLGDVVVSTPKGTSGGVVQYDFGKTVDNGDFTPTGSLNKPPRVLLVGLHNLDGKHRRQGNEISKFLSEMTRKYPHMEQNVSYPGIENDRLYEAGYKHEDENRTCASCDDSKVKKRTPRSRNVPVIHYGLIASGNQVMKDGITRDRLGKQLDVLCFEMEAAGLMDNFPCLVIRGVSDYADSHKNKRWQGYAAATAAAYVKELLYVVRGNNVVEMPTAPTATTPPPGSKAQVRSTDVNITNEFERKMAALIPIPEKGRSDVPRTRYSHSKIQEISQLLRDVSLDGWSRSAGIYTVLRTLRKQEDMTEFIKNGITDLWLPFFPESIPPGLAPSTFKRFLKAQTIVLTETPDLVTGKHCHLTQEDLDEGFPKQCEWKATLGSGGFGFVDKISISSVEPNPPVYALKRIRREKDFQKTQEAMKYLESELEVLKKIKHQHFVKYVGSYTDPSFVGLIMAPVADENLASFLRNVPNVARNERESQRRLLWSFFGCLANALAHLHFVFDIRHKDIKPQNILVRRNNILLTDFGMALDWSDTLETTTRGEMRKTDKYCAPEAAAAYEPRNSKSDIWSLGCVFLEMMTILKGETMSTIEQFFRGNGSQSPFFRSNQEAICDWLTRLKRNGFPANEDSEFGNTPLEWIQEMLRQEAKLRPSSRELLDSILASRTNPDQGIKFHGICCDSGELGRGGVDSTVDTGSNVSASS
jgi:nucleoside phosphorylase